MAAALLEVCRSPMDPISAMMAERRPADAPSSWVPAFAGTTW